MRNVLSFLLITAGTIGASIAAARTMPDTEGWESAWQVDTAWFIVSLIVMFVGIAIRTKAIATEIDRGSGTGIDRLHGLMKNLQERLQTLSSRLEELDENALYLQLDEIVSGPVSEWIENRQVLIDLHGMGAYAEVMSPFAQGERYLNRAWSAAVDGYKDEAVTYINKSLPVFQSAMESMPSIDR